MRSPNTPLYRNLNLKRTLKSTIRQNQETSINEDLDEPNSVELGKEMDEIFEEIKQESKETQSVDTHPEIETPVAPLHVSKLEIRGGTTPIEKTLEVSKPLSKKETKIILGGKSLLAPQPPKDKSMQVKIVT